MLETMLSEDKYVYQCSKCNFLASVGGDTDKIHQCLKCKSIMTNTGVTRKKWDSITKDEKIALIQKINKMPSPEKNYTDSESALIAEINSIKPYLKTLTENVGTIKTILMFYFVITLLGFLYVFLNALS